MQGYDTSSDGKQANAAAHGALGVIALGTPELENVSGFEEQLRHLSFPDLRWLSREGKPNDHFEQRRATLLSIERMKKLLAGSGKTPERPPQGST